MFGAGSCMTRWWNSGRCLFWASLVENQHFAKPAVRVDWRFAFSCSRNSVRKTLKCSDSCMTWFSNSDRCFSATSKHPYCHWSRPHCTVMFCKKENTCLSCRFLVNTGRCLFCNQWASLVTGHAHYFLQKGKYSKIHFWAGPSDTKIDSHIHWRQSTLKNMN